MKGRHLLTAAVALFVAAAIGTTVRAKNDDKDKNKNAPQEVVVDFGVAGQAGANNHFLVPDEASVAKGGSIVFRVNGGGHGVSIYKISRNTTRDDIINAAGSPEGLCPIRTNCPADFIAAAHRIHDGQDHLVADIATDPPAQRLDDGARILVGTAAQIAAEDPGRFQNGAPIAGTATAAAQASERIAVRFTKNGRYLVICMNRAHSINDWMFGFVNVGDSGDDDE
jgi:plastocyanin